MIGKTLNERYTLTSSLGRGGMGEVYLAVDSWQYNRQVAIKALNPQLSHEEAHLNRFRLEAGILKRLNHPNIVEYIEDFAQDDQHFIVMEYVDGGNLLDFVQATGPLNEDIFRQITLALTDALTRAHDNGIIHRDIKPENILLTTEGVPKLSDFGVAWLLDRPQDEGGRNFAGSPYYMSPQRWEGIAPRQADDIWSLGIIMFEMVAGHVPFYGRTEMATVHDIINKPTPDLREIRSDLPPGYAAIIERCLEKFPPRRYTLMRKVAADFEAGQPEEGATRRDGTFPPGHRNRWLFALIAAVITLGLIIGGFIMLVNRQQATPPSTLAAVLVTNTIVATETPFVITATPLISPTPLGSATSRVTSTIQIVTATALPTNTPVATMTATATSTQTPAPTATETPLPSNTPLPSDTPTVTLTATGSATPTTTATATQQPTATETAMPTATATITNTPRPTLTPSNTPTSTPDGLATEQALAQATLDQLSTLVAPTATPAPSPQPQPTEAPDYSRYPASMRVLDDFNAGAGRWELPPEWRLDTQTDGNSVLAANAAGIARRMDAADWGRYFSQQFRFMLGQDGAFQVDYFGDLSRCRVIYTEVTESGIALKYNNQPTIDGGCAREGIPIVTIEEPISGFVWHTLRLEARNEFLLIHLDGVRLSRIRNPIPESIGPNGMITVPEGATPPLLFDDFVVNMLNPRDDVDLIWRAADAYNLVDIADDLHAVVIETRIDGDYVDAVWAVGPDDVAAQSYMLQPDNPTDDIRHFWVYLPNATLNKGVYAFIPLHDDVEVTGRRFTSPHRGGYSFSDAPRDIDASLTTNGLQLSWTPASPVEGAFNPGGSYLIRLHAADADFDTRLFHPLYEDRGAASVPRYVLPWNQLYRPPTSTGLALSELPDGEYQLEIWAVSGRPSSGDEERVIDSSQTLTLVIEDENITVIHADGTALSGIIRP